MQIFRISIYYRGADRSQGGDHGSEGRNSRVFYHKGQMNQRNILTALMAGDCGESETDALSNPVVKPRGQILVTGEATPG